MTCIIGIAQDEKIYMGSDGAATTLDGVKSSVVIPKIFEKDEYLLGYAGSFRMGKFLQYNVDLPKPPSWARGSKKLDEFLNGIVVPAIKKQVKEAELEIGEKEDFSYLIGLRGHIFELDENWAVHESTQSYISIGSGMDIALGSLYSTSGWKSPIKRITVALEASAFYNTFVSQPFTILEK
jgi:ATP-dependent protease HslVU (ClpYQ) peptidase subunit